ncbi:OTU domain-containing protein 4 isoform X2 [Ambystoma mexicanum]
MLCFSNGNHYDIVYTATYTDSAALCQSILYEMLYEKVLSTDVSKILLELKSTDRPKEEIIGSDEDSESDADEVSRGKHSPVSNMNGLKSSSGNKLPNNGNTFFFLPRKVLRSLNPALYRNLEYDVWLTSMRDQQKRDFSIAAGMQYSVGDKCKVRLEPTGKFYDGHIQEVSSEKGPVVVYVEEFGKKFNVPMKSLKPLPQASAHSTPREGWNTVSGKKIKRVPFGSAAHLQSDTEHRGQKIAGKPGKAQSTLPPRLQQTAGNRQQQFSPSPGPTSQHIPIEQRSQNRSPAQATGRKLERERSEEFEFSNKECRYFGLSPEERRERQVMEESRSLYEIQHLDEQAFPALSSRTTTQTGDVYNQRKLSNERSSKQKIDLEERKDLNIEINHCDQIHQINTAERQDECLPASSEPPSSVAPPSCMTPAPPDTLPDLPLHPVVPPIVPLMPDTVPGWPTEPATYSSPGISAQLTVPPGILASTANPDSAMAQDQGISPPFTTVPVPLQAVNQPMMPLPQTMSLYQDPLYPGFPLDENGERATAPPFSLCKSGEDLPTDKSILQFFFNLGVKAYSCPMWAPHSYLYPLHQAYLNMCRMYPKIPVYPHHTWYQDVSASENENSLHTSQHPLMPNETRVNGQGAQGGTASSPPPWFLSTVQLSQNTGPTSNLCGIEAENMVPPPHAIYTDSVGNKGVYPQSALGHSSFLGPVPLAHSFFPPVWYGYPMQGFVESSTAQHNMVATVTDSDLSKGYSSSAAAETRMDQFQEVDNEHAASVPEEPITSVSSEQPNISIQLAKEEPMRTNTPVPPQKADQIDFSVEAKEMKGDVVVPSPLPADGELCDLTNAPVLSSKKTELTGDPKATVTIPDTGQQTRPHRTREESSEDEREVSDMLRSGRSKNFYNQTYGSRKYRNDRGYAPNRGGYHYLRNEDGWKGAGSRNREDVYQAHRGFRGRPYKSDNRRRPSGDPYRGYQVYDSPSPYQKHT